VKCPKCDGMKEIPCMTRAMEYDTKTCPWCKGKGEVKDLCPMCGHPLAICGWDKHKNARWHCCKCGWKNYEGSIYSAYGESMSGEKRQECE
jgi:hypothetical protein